VGSEMCIRDRRYSECGLRIGALVTKNRLLRNTVMKFCQARLCPPLLGQLVSLASLQASDNYFTETASEYRRRRDFLVKRLNRIPGVYSPLPMGAFYTIARLPVKNADHFCSWCLSDFSYQNQTVFLAPASGFYFSPLKGENEVRVAYVLNCNEIEKALTILEKALEEYKKVEK